MQSTKQQTQSSNNYLYRILFYGAKPFYYRSGVRFLLGFPDCQHGNLAFSTTLPPVGFRYLPAGESFDTPAGGPYKGSTLSPGDEQNPEPGEVDAGTYRTPGITAARETSETRGMDRVDLSARQNCSMEEEIQQSDTEPGSCRETVPAQIEMVEQMEQAAPTAETTGTEETVEAARKKENIEIPGFSQKSIVFPSLARKRINTDTVEQTGKTKIAEGNVISEKTGRTTSTNPTPNSVSTVLTPLPGGMEKKSLNDAETANGEVKNVPGKSSAVAPPPRKPRKVKIAEETVISEKTRRTTSPNPAANPVSTLLIPSPVGMEKTSLHDVETASGKVLNVPGKLSAIAPPPRTPGKAKIAEKGVILVKPVPRDEIVGRSLREAAVRIEQLRREVQRLKAKAPATQPGVDREIEKEHLQTSEPAVQERVVSGQPTQSTQPTQTTSPDRVPWVFWEMSYMNRLHLRTL